MAEHHPIHTLPSWKTRWLVSLLALSTAFIDQNRHYGADAFDTRSHLARRPGLEHASLGTSKRLSSRHQNPQAPRKRGTPTSQRISYQGRPFSTTFFVASSTGGKSLNIDFSNDEDELMWDCILDPMSCDECTAYVGHHLDAPKDSINWNMKEVEDIDKVTLRDKISMAATGAGVIVSFALLIAISGPGSWRFFLAGGLCAAASHAIPTPLDVVKTKQQVDPSLQDLSFVQATKKIVKNEGIGALLAGLGPTIVGYLLEGAMKFGVYEVLKPATTRMMIALAKATSLTFLRSQVLAFIVCGMVAGTAASVVLAPMEALRIRLVSEPNFAPKGWVQGGRRIIKREGVLSLWRGVRPQIYKQVPYTVTKNVSFDYLTKFAYRVSIASGLAMNHGTKFAILLFSAGFASILSCVSSQPGDMLLSLVSARQGEFRSTNDIARDILKSDKGIRGFFVGLNCRICHVGIIVTLQLVLYDFLKRLCGGIATGAH